MDATQLKEIHDFLLSLAYKAGDIINNALPDSSGTDLKKNSLFAFPAPQPKRLIDPGADLVTQYDRAVENMISSSLREKYPEYAYVPPNDQGLPPTRFLTARIRCGSASTGKKHTAQNAL